MEKYSGIDLHLNNCVVAVIDESDRVCCQQRVPNDLPKIVALLEPYRDELAGVVVESTFNWYWLVDGLRAAGFEVKLANTAALPQYSGLKYSGDEHDARHLAHLLRLNLLRMGYVFPPECALYATWLANASSWFVAARSTSFHSKRPSPARPAAASVPT